MTLLINGNEQKLPENATVADALTMFGITNPLTIVELNGHVIPKSDFAHTVLSTGDTVEFIQLMGGG